MSSSVGAAGSSGFVTRAVFGLTVKLWDDLRSPSALEWQHCLLVTE